MTDAQLQLETSRPASDDASPPAFAGREDLTYPAERGLADLWAENFRRRGVECEVVPNGRKWTVVG